MTILLYVRRKGWPVKSLTVECEYQREVLDDLGQISETSNAFVDAIDRTIRIDGELSSKQIERVTYIAGRCPVHKLLESKPLIRDNVIIQ